MNIESPGVAHAPCFRALQCGSATAGSTMTTWWPLRTRATTAISSLPVSSLTINEGLLTRDRRDGE